MLESRKQNKGHWSSQGHFDFPVVVLEHAVEVREQCAASVLEPLARVSYADSINAKCKVTFMGHVAGMAEKAIVAMNASGKEVKPVNVTVKLGNQQRIINARLGDVYENEGELEPVWAENPSTIHAQAMSMMSDLFDKIYGAGKDENVEASVFVWVHFKCIYSPALGAGDIKGAMVVYDRSGEQKKSFLF